MGDFCKFENVKKACAKSCGTCGSSPSPVPQPPSPQPSPSPASDCADDPDEACEYYSENDFCKFENVKKACAKSCGTCGSSTVPELTPPFTSPSPASDCADDPEEACEYYSKNDFCNLENVRRACAKSCG